MNRRTLLLAAPALVASARAQSWPSRPIRLLIPYPPGGLTDVMARMIAEPLRITLGQPVVIENRAGAAGAIAMREVAQAAPDGHTLVITNNGPTSIIPALRRDAGYDAVHSFTPLALVALQPLVLLSSTEQLPVQDLAGLVAYAKARPGQLNFASGGVGSLGHLGGLLFNREAGINVVHVPYQGAAPTLTAVVSGQVHFAVTSFTTTAAEQVVGGRLRLLGVSSPEAWPLLPETPTMASVAPGFQAQAWHGVLGPAGLPPAIVARLNTEIDKVLAEPAVRSRFRASGVEAGGGGSEALAQRIRAEVPQWQAVIRDAGLVVE